MEWTAPIVRPQLHVLNSLALPLPPNDLNSTSGTANEAGGKKVGKLNPAFVLEMMGFPVNWTLLPFLPEGGMGEINTH